MHLDLEKFAVYAVGGFVRDRLLNRDPEDHDYVVVGATPADMISAGFQPIDASFPVFIHPTSRDEYALARKERKVGLGYRGFEVEFDPTVSLRDDLYRRDLTVNAMARRVTGWNSEGHAKLSDEVIDPYCGQQDLIDGVLRHVSDAFAEDPVRVLRTARFAARYLFDIHPDTLLLMREVALELTHVPQERIWAEFEKGLSEQYPWLMFEALRACGAMGVDALKPYGGASTHRMRFFTRDTPLDIRFILAARGFKGTDYVKCRIPVDLARVSDAFNADSTELVTYATRDVFERLSLLTAFRAITDDTKLFKCMAALTLYTPADSEFVLNDVKLLMTQDLRNIRSVDCTSIAASCTNGVEIKRKIFEARIAAML